MRTLPEMAIFIEKMTKITFIIMEMSLSFTLNNATHHNVASLTNLTNMLPVQDKLSYLEGRREGSLLRDRQAMNVINELEIPLSGILQELTKGPLQGKSLVLFLDGDYKAESRLNYIQKYIQVPLILYTAYSEMDNVLLTSSGDNAYRNSLVQKANNSASVNSDGVVRKYDGIKHISYQEEDYSSIRGDVLIYITDGPSSTVLQNPPLSWNFAAILFLSSSVECDIKSLLQAPLALMTQSVVFLLPVYLTSFPGESPDLKFRVYTWQSLHSQEELLNLGTWSPSSFPTWNSLFMDRFPSFHGSMIHVSSDRADFPFLFLNPDRSFDGLSKRLMDILGSRLNFTYDLTERPQDKKYGTFEDGEWNGMLGEVYRREKNLTINSFAITEERFRDFQASVTYYREGFAFFIAVPPPLPRWLSMTYPLTLSVWLGTAITLVLTALAFYLIPFRPKFTTSWFNSFIYIVKGLLKQSASDVPPSWNLRLFLAFWWLGSYVIIVSYTCNLIAILTVPVYPARLQTVEHLAQSDYRLCMLDYGEFVPGALAASSEKNLFTLGSKLDLIPYIDEEIEGDRVCSELVLEGTYSHLDLYPHLENLYHFFGHSHRIYTLKEKIYETNIAFFFPKHTPWVYKFNQGIQRVLEANLMEKWLSDIKSKRQRNTKKEASTSSDQPLSLSHLQGPFYILAIGVILSTLAFLAEVFWESRT